MTFSTDSHIFPSKCWEPLLTLLILCFSIDDGKFRVGLMTFSTDSHRVFDLRDYRSNLLTIVGTESARYRSGQKNTAAAIDYVRTQMFTRERGDRDWARNYILLLTGNTQRFVITKYALDIFIMLLISSL